MSIYVQKRKAFMDLKERGEVRAMDKRILIGILILIVAMVFSGGILAQEILSPRAFSGTITKVDLEKKEFSVQNKEEEMRFIWTPETWVNGFSDGKEGFVSDNLKAGMLVTIEYTNLKNHRVASRINVEVNTHGTLKGWEFPFGCGLSLC
jgi:hypothetical protein